MLENPVYHALNGPQADLAERAGRAVRYPATMAPFGALPPDPTAADWAALATVANGNVALIDPGEIPPGWTVTRRLDVTQMVLERTLEPGPVFEELTDDDVADMLALVEATRPGPFGPDTFRLGRYLGIKDDGKLVAMTGERMRPAGWTEVSAVCTAPSHRGRGLARQLVTAVAAAIQQRGEGAFLHVMSANTAAIALYESMGFTRSRTGWVIGLATRA